jgi:hypothetical protein
MVHLLRRDAEEDAGRTMNCEHNLVNARVIECHRCECGIGRRQLALGYLDAHDFYGKHAGHAMRITCVCGHAEEFGGETAPVRDPAWMLPPHERPRTRREAVYDYSKIVHCMRPPSTSTSSGCRDGTHAGCSCECDGCNGRTWASKPAEGA